MACASEPEDFPVSECSVEHNDQLLASMGPEMYRMFTPGAEAGPELKRIEEDIPASPLASYPSSCPLDLRLLAHLDSGDEPEGDPAIDGLMGSPVPTIKSRSEPALEPSSKGPINITSMRKSLTDLRRSLATPEREDFKIFQKSVSMECLGTSSASSMVVQEVARLARRVECMERAFLMSPTEAIQGQQDADASPGDQNRYSTELCAQFVEVLERGREARKRELAELEHRMAESLYRVECLCSGGGQRLAFQEQLEAQGREHAARLAKGAAAFSKALECERVARQKELVELRETVAGRHDSVVSSTGGTLHHPAGDAQSTDEHAQDMNSEDASVRGAIASSKAALSQHVAELHWQLSEDLMVKLREKVNAATEVWEQRIQAVSGLFEIHEASPCLHSRKLKDLAEQLQGQDAHYQALDSKDGSAGDNRTRCRSSLIARYEALDASDFAAFNIDEDEDEDPSWTQNLVQKEFSGMSFIDIPTEMEGHPARPRRPSHGGHASAADIADERGITTVVQPHGRSPWRGASREALVKRPLSNKFSKLGAPLTASHGYSR